MQRNSFYFRRWLILGVGVSCLVGLSTGCPFASPDPSTQDDEDPAQQPVPTEEFELTVRALGNGDVERTADGQLVTLTAVPETGWVFDKWLGATESTVNPLVLLLDESMSVDARFVLAEIVDSDGDGVPDAEDVCPGEDDGIDTDQDGVPNGCDTCPRDPDNDVDGDRYMRGCGQLSERRRRRAGGQRR